MTPVELNKTDGWKPLVAQTCDVQNISKKVDVEFLVAPTDTPPTPDEYGFSYKPGEREGFEVGSGETLYAYNRNATKALVLARETS